MDLQFPGVAPGKQHQQCLWCVLQPLDDMELSFERAVSKADS